MCRVCVRCTPLIIPLPPPPASVAQPEHRCQPTCTNRRSPAAPQRPQSSPGGRSCWMWSVAEASPPPRSSPTADRADQPDRRPPPRLKQRRAPSTSDCADASPPHHASTPVPGVTHAALPASSCQRGPSKRTRFAAVRSPRTLVAFIMGVVSPTRARAEDALITPVRLSDRPEAIDSADKAEITRTQPRRRTCTRRRCSGWQRPSGRKKMW